MSPGKLDFQSLCEAFGIAAGPRSSITVVGALINPKIPVRISTFARLKAARSLGLTLILCKASTWEEVVEALRSWQRRSWCRRHRRGFLLCQPARRYYRARRAPCVAGEPPTKEYVVDGGLMSYSPDRGDVFRIAGSYLGKSSRERIGRPAGPIADEIRIGSQPKNRENIGTNGTALAHRLSRRNNPVSPSFQLLLATRSNKQAVGALVVPKTR